MEASRMTSATMGRGFYMLLKFKDGCAGLQIIYDKVSSDLWWQKELIYVI